MRTEQLLLALSIAREKSLTKGAEVMHISQPNASNMLKALESEIGYCIFKRERNSILLTDEGKVFLEEAVKIEQALNHISLAGKITRQVDLPHSLISSNSRSARLKRCVSDTIGQSNRLYAP